MALEGLSADASIVAGKVSQTMKEELAKAPDAAGDSRGATVITPPTTNHPTKKNKKRIAVDQVLPLLSSSPDLPAGRTPPASAEVGTILSFEPMPNEAPQLGHEGD